MPEKFDPYFTWLGIPPEIIDTCRIALELHARGIIKFQFWSAAIHRRF